MPSGARQQSVQGHSNVNQGELLFNIQKRVLNFQRQSCCLSRNPETVVFILYLLGGDFSLNGRETGEMDASQRDI